jgi:hypothetical protein
MELTRFWPKVYTLPKEPSLVNSREVLVTVMVTLVLAAWPGGNQASVRRAPLAPAAARRASRLLALGLAWRGGAALPWPGLGGSGTCGALGGALAHSGAGRRT